LANDHLADEDGFLRKVPSKLLPCRQ
jgi:hypothetical protein